MFCKEEIEQNKPVSTHKFIIKSVDDKSEVVYMSILISHTKLAFMRELKHMFPCLFELNLTLRHNLVRASYLFSVLSQNILNKHVMMGIHS